MSVGEPRSGSYVTSRKSTGEAIAFIDEAIAFIDELTDEHFRRPYEMRNLYLSR